MLLVAVFCPFFDRQISEYINVFKMKRKSNTLSKNVGFPSPDNQTSGNPQTHKFTFTSARQNKTRKRFVNIVPNLHSPFDAADVHPCVIATSHHQVLGCAPEKAAPVGFQTTCSADRALDPQQRSGCANPIKSVTIVNENTLLPVEQPRTLLPSDGLASGATAQSRPVDESAVLTLLS